MKKNLLICLILFYSVSGFSQQIRRCSSADLLKSQIQNNPSFINKVKESESAIKLFQDRLAGSLTTAGNTPDTEVFLIPVVVHVLYDTSLINISDAQIQSQIDVLNEDYNRLNWDSINTPNAFKNAAGKLKVKFRLAFRDTNGNLTNGITRTYTKNHGFSFLSNAMKHYSTGGADAWDPSKFLNIWVCSLSNGYLGFATFPYDLPKSDDGVVIHYACFGRHGSSPAPFDLGRTTTHEVGHWLGLYHTWGDDDNESNKCLGSDSIADTPNESVEAYGKPIFPLVDGCSPDGNGAMFMNYMDYVDDNSMNMFTSGQTFRMFTVLQTLRSSIISTGTQFANSINDVSTNQIKIYPNPSKDIFHLSNVPPNSLITVYNIMGQQVYQSMAESTTQNIDLTGAAFGTYIVRISSQKAISTYKMTVSY